MPDIDKICDLVHTKAISLTPKKRMYSSGIEIELEKFKLENSRIEEPEIRRKLRPCCAEKEASI